MRPGGRSEIKCLSRLILEVGEEIVKVFVLSRSVVSDSFVTQWTVPGSSVNGISQARILEWVVMSFSRGSS